MSLRWTAIIGQRPKLRVYPRLVVRSGDKACPGNIFDQVVIKRSDQSIDIRKRRGHIVSNDGICKKSRAAGGSIL